MTRFSMAALGAVILFASLPAASAEVATSTMMIKKIDRFVTTHAGEFIDDKLTLEQVVQMKLIAHQAAVAATCDGFTLSDCRSGA